MAYSNPRDSAAPPVIGAEWEDWAALLPWRGPMHFVLGHFIFAQD
jgi:hypothetical protein